KRNHSGWYGEIRMIRHVEYLGPKLQRTSFINAEGFCQRHVEVCETRSDECVPSEIAALIGRRQFKRIDIPVAGGSTEDWIVRSSRFHVRALIHGEACRIEVSRLVETHAHGKWMTGRQRGNIVELPPFYESAGDTVQRLAKRQIVGPIERQ